MRYSEQLMEHIEYAFHAFCKIVLRHEAMNAWRDLKRKEEREISLDYLMSENFLNRLLWTATLKSRTSRPYFLCWERKLSLMMNG